LSETERNVANWTQVNAAYTAEEGRRAGAAGEIPWGIFDVPESELGTLADVEGLDAVELGCGTAYVSVWLARRGARPVGELERVVEVQSSPEAETHEFYSDIPVEWAQGWPAEEIWVARRR
jgi:hypothetical protein